jgi:dihydroneopterin aldolase
MPNGFEMNVKSLRPCRRDRLHRIFVRDLVLLTYIGVHAHEQRASQRLRINLEISARLDEVLHDDLKNTICYDSIAQAIRRLAAEGHIGLVETFAGRVLDICLTDPRARHATVTVEKLDVFDDAAAVGVTISADAG